MKRILSVALITMLLSPMFIMAQDIDSVTVTDNEEGFRFETIKAIPTTPVRDQHRSGTCWAFSTVSFLESELIRMGKGEIDLSVMFVVHHTMQDRAMDYFRHYGGTQFAPGGSAYDVVYCLKNYGMVTKEAMPGIMYGDTLPNHNELDAVAKGFIQALVNADKVKKYSKVWPKAFAGIYDAYLGECPETFTYKGKSYTPQSFVKYLGLNADDYVSLTSYTHHPFYTQFALEVPDNWRHDMMYNVPLDELMSVIDNALENGYTIAWGADVSEIGFTRKGIGVVPDADNGADLTGSDMAHWLGMSDSEKRDELTKKPLPEKVITQEMRQDAYDSQENTDDHGMLIFGTAKDQNGKRYYMIQNSWGTVRSDYKGIWYISEAFMQYKTNDILVHKDAIPKELRKKLGIK